MSFVKPYRILARIKNNRLWRAVLDLHPEVKTQSDAARCVNVGIGIFGNIMNMKLWPASTRKDGSVRWTSIAVRISRALAYDSEYLFDPEYYGVKVAALPKFVSLEVGIAEIDRREVEQLPAPMEEIMDDNFRNLQTAMKRVLATLTPREEQVLRMRFGVDEDKQITASEVADRFAISRKRVYEVESRALRKLRLKSFMG